MAQYKIVGSYRVIDVEPNPDVVLAPNPLVANQSYAFSVDSPEQLEALIIANAEAKAAGTSQTANADAAVLAQFQADEDTVDS
jgi:hypothetical protein